MSLLNLYKDWNCSQSKSFTVGTCKVSGPAAVLNNWVPVGFSGQTIPPAGGIRGMYGSYDQRPFSGQDFQFIGGADQGTLKLFTNEEGILVDRESEVYGASDIWNAYFSGFYRWTDQETQEEDQNSYYIQSYRANADAYTFYCGIYSQSPIEGTRNQWSYVQYYRTNEQAIGISDYAKNNGYTEVRIFYTEIEEQKFYMIAYGFNPEYNNILWGIAGGALFLIPEGWFKQGSPYDYTGSESTPNSDESAFNPPQEGEWRDSTSYRVITDTNPFGFNTGNGLKLFILPKDALGTIMQGIYSSSGASATNMISQGFDILTGGNGNRPYNEIEAMLKGIVCCHYIPGVANIVGSYMKLSTICGYRVWTAQDMNATAARSGTIYEWDSSSFYISRRLNSFLDYEPYTTITLQLPFMNSISLPPSMVYDTTIYIHYSMDIFTGLLSASIMIYDQVHDRYNLFSKQQAFVKTDIPIFGSGSNTATFSSMCSSILSLGKNASTGNIGGVLESSVSLLDSQSKLHQGVAVGKENTNGISSYFESREINLLVSTPIPAIPGGDMFDSNGNLSNQNVFLQQTGIVSNTKGTVNDFKGYAKFQSVKLNNVPATQAVKEQIESQLLQGVYIR